MPQSQRQSDLLAILDGFTTLAAVRPDLSAAFVKEVTGNTRRAGREFLEHLQDFFEKEGLNLDIKQVGGMVGELLFRENENS